jgi:APA family basic amino acid/polyamine antiporter
LSSRKALGFWTGLALVGLFEFALLLATVTVLVPYAFTAAAQIVLIRRDPELWVGPDATRAIAPSVVGLTFAVLAIVRVGSTSIVMGGVLLLLGLPFYFWSRFRAGRLTESA